MREVKRMKGNSIHIGALSFVNDKELITAICDVMVILAELDDR